MKKSTTRNSMKEMDHIANVIGKNVFKFRASHGMTLEDLAECAECDPSTVGRIERAQTNASVFMLAKIAAALGVTLIDLLEGN